LEGIKAWLKHTGIYDKFFNPVSPTTEANLDMPPKQNVLSDTDDSKEQPTDKAPKGWSNPFKGLNINEDQWFEMWHNHVPYLAEQQSRIFIIKTTCEPKLTDTEIGKRLGISRVAVYNAYKSAVSKVEQNRKNRSK
jgi:hypothetical protein